MATLFKILEILIPILIGLGFRLTKVFGDEEGDVLRRFVVRFTLPVMVFFSMYDAGGEDLSALPSMLAALILLTGAMFLVAFLATRFVNGPGSKSAVHACGTFSNYGWIGFGVCQVLLGDAGLRRAVFFLLLWWPVFYGFGLLIGLIHTRGQKGGVPVGKAVKLTAPIVGMTLLGLSFSLTHWGLPRLLETALRPFGQMTVPLILFGIGAMLDFSGIHKALRPALLVSGVTLVLAPVVGWGIAALLPLDEVSYAVVILQAAMPVATSTPLLRENFELDMDLTNTSIILSTVLSMVTLPVVAALVIS